MRYALLVVLLACNKGDDGPRAKGSLVFEERANADVFLATEAEVMKSERVLRGVRERYHIEVKASAIQVARRPGTMILDVSVTDKDGHRAAETCNQVMRTYFDLRASLALEEIQREMQFLDEERQRKPNDTEIVRRLDELNKRRALQENDVRLLEPCVFTR